MIEALIGAGVAVIFWKCVVLWVDECNWRFGPFRRSDIYPNVKNAQVVPPVTWKYLWSYFWWGEGAEPSAWLFSLGFGLGIFCIIYFV